MEYVLRAVFTSIPLCSTPRAIPPAKLITEIIRPAIASPFTYLLAPSIEPKKEASS